MPVQPQQATEFGERFSSDQRRVILLNATVRKIRMPIPISDSNGARPKRCPNLIGPARRADEIETIAPRPALNGDPAMLDGGVPRKELGGE